MSLFDALSQIAEQIKQHRELMNKSEATVEQVSVLPFVDALGYDTQNPAEVRKQYAILNWDAVDFAVLRDSEPIMVVEAKKASEALAKHWKQLFQYFNADKARVGILTNGIEYRIYIDSVKQNIMDNEPSLIINLDNLDKVAVAQLDNFTKARFHPEHSLRKVKITNLLANELRQPSDEFVRYFAKRIHSGSVWQNVIDEFRPIVKQCFDNLVGRGTTPPPPEPPPPGSDIRVFGYYEEHQFEAELLRKSVEDGLTIAGNQIRFNGETTWLKDAAVKAIRSVDPSFNPTRTFPNGFKFWHVVDPADGKEYMIRYVSGWDMTDEALRQRVLGES